MNANNRCPACNAELAANAPRGLCPACLLQGGLATQTAGTGGSNSSQGADFVPPTPAELAPHFPDLEVLELLGRGGMGVVYKARQKRLDRLVALKILAPRIGHDPAFAERFAREARAMAMLNHPHIVAVYDFGQTAVRGERREERGEGTSNLPSPASGSGAGGEGGLYYFLMEFVDGLNLRRLLDAGKLAPKEALAIVPQICDALQYAHDHGVVHRDIKPENVLLDKEGRVKIADFGIAKLVGREAVGCVKRTDENAPAADGSAFHAPDEPLTAAGQIIGTPQYMAPEQFAHPQEVDHRADIYSLGVVFYQMLTGELPIGRFAPPSQRVQIDVRLDEVVLRALEKEPERRYQQVSEIRTRVETIATTQGQPPVDAQAIAQEILARDYVLDIGSCLRRGCALVKNDFWAVVGMTALVLLILHGAALLQLMALVIGGPLVGGLCLFLLKRTRGEHATVEATLAGLRTAFVAVFFQLFLTGLVTALLTMAGLLCLILPGVYLGVAWSFALAIAADKRLDCWPAMELSRKMISKHWWKVFGFLGLLAIFNLAGILAFGVGVFLTAPITLAALMYAYEDIFSSTGVLPSDDAGHAGEPLPSTGRASGTPRGRLALWYTRRKSLFWSICVALLVGFVLRQWVVEVNYAVTDAVRPEVPRGAYVFVFKLAQVFSPGDIIVYRRDNVHILARVAASNPDGSVLMVQRDNRRPQSVRLSEVVGKVIFNTRPSIFDSPILAPPPDDAQHHETPRPGTGGASGTPHTGPAGGKPHAVAPARDADPDSDGDGLPDFQEAHKYRTDPKKTDTAGKGVSDGGWEQRREFTYSVRAVIRVMRPYNLQALCDDYQDVRVLAENKEYAELEVVVYPLNSNAEAIEENPNWKKDYAGMKEYLAPGITTNWDDKMRKDLLGELAEDGIDPDRLTDKEVVEKVSRWLFSHSKYRSMFGTFYVGFSDGKPAVLPGLEKAFEHEKGDPKWTVQQEFEHELLGKEMFAGKTHGSCTSTAIYQTTVLRALGLPTRMILCIPLADASDAAQVEMVHQGLTHHQVRRDAWLGVLAGQDSFSSHTFCEAFVGGRWRRLNSATLGQNVLSQNYLGLMIKVHAFNDLSEANLAATWGTRYAHHLRDDVFKHSNPYCLVNVSDHFGKYANVPNPPVAAYEHTQVTLEKAYWPDSKDAPTMIRDLRSGTQPGGACFFVHCREWLENARHQYRLFMSRADRNFILRAKGQPDVLCHLSMSSVTSRSRNIRELEMIIPPAEYAKMAKGVAYALQPVNAVKDYAWKVRDGLAITRQ